MKKFRVQIKDVENCTYSQVFEATTEDKATDLAIDCARKYFGQDFQILNVTEV